MTRPGDVNYHQPKQQNIGIIILRLTRWEISQELRTMRQGYYSLGMMPTCSY